MAQISGVILDNRKQVETALTAIYGLGRPTAQTVLATAKVDGVVRVKDLNDSQIQAIQKAINDDSQVQVEGDRRQVVMGNIKHLKDIQSYRGKRHLAKLPSRGQRTRTNARTRRGKKVTVGGTTKKAPSKT